MDNIPCDPTLPMRVREVPSFTTTDVSPPDYRRRFLIILAILFLLLFPVISETYFRCAICGMKQTKWRIMGFGVPLYSWKRPTSSSDWYQQNIEPEHQHVWMQTGYMEGKTFYGLNTFMFQSSSLSTGPLVYLPLSSSSQIRIYQMSPNPKQARDIFLRLSYNEPYESDAYKEQLELWMQLSEWMQSGMEEPWPFETQ